MRKENTNVFIFALVLGVALAVSASVWATTIGTNITVDGTSTLTGNVTASGTLDVTGASTFTGLGKFGGGLIGQASSTFSSTLDVTGALTTKGNVTLGDTTGDTVTVDGTLKVGTNGTNITNLIHGFCDFGPIVASQTIAATSTGTVACTTQAPTGHALGDKIWLTASTTAIGLANGSNNISYTGLASSTAAGRIQAMLYNGTGAAFTVTTSSWQYFIIK